MKISILRKAVAGILILLITFTILSVVPQVNGVIHGPFWRMFMHDPQHTGSTEYSGCNSPRVKGTFDAHNPISSTPAIDEEGNIYLLTTSGTLFAISPQGEIMWNFKTGTGIPGASFWVTPLIACAEGIGGVYSDETTPQFLIYFGAGNQFFALDKEGNLKWQTPLSPMGNVVGSPNVCQINGIMQATTLGWVILNGGDGSVVKPIHYGHPCLPPALSRTTHPFELGKMYVPSGNFLFCWDGSEDSLLWSFDVGSGGKVYSPSIGPDGTIYFRSDQKLYAVNPDGSEKWSVNFQGTALPAIGSDGTIYLGSTDKTFQALNPANGEVLWKFTEGHSLYSAATIDANGVIYFGSEDGKLYALNSDGSLKWSFDAGSTVAAPPSIAPDGTIYFGTADGLLYALEENPILAGTPTPTLSLSFPDVPSDYWAYAEIMKLVGEGVIKGYPDGTFKPEFPVTRAEFSKMVLLSLGYSQEFPSTPSFSDLDPTEWYYGYVEGAAKHGLVKGYPDGTFKPQGNITLAEVLTVIVRAKGWSEVSPPGPPPYIFLHDRDDSVRLITAEDWYYGVVGAAAQNGLLRFPDYSQITVPGAGSGEYEVRFNSPATRAQTAVFLSRI